VKTNLKDHEIMKDHVRDSTIQKLKNVKRILQVLCLKWKSFILEGGGSNVKKKSVPLYLLTVKVKVSSIFEDGK